MNPGFSPFALAAALTWTLASTLGIGALAAARSAEPARTEADDPPKPIVVKVLVLNYDPRIPSENNRPLHEVGGWNDPRELAKGYAGDLERVTDGLIRHRVVEWRDLDEFPAKIDGFRYTAESYMACRATNSGWHEPDALDYARVFREQKVIPRIDSGEIDEVWLFGGPYFGYGESAMAGPRAFHINGPVIDGRAVPSSRPFAIMGFNYERGVAETLHNLCHRAEATLTRVHGGWKTDELVHDWARFAANAKQSNGVAACGTCHYPPNGERDYDYDNPRVVLSDADDWLNYPRLSGIRKPVSRETWGGPDYHRNYMGWWFRRLPRAAGTSPEGRLNNWWRYIYEFDAFDGRGLPRPASDPRR